MDDKSADNSSDQPATSSLRREWTTPELTEYGSVAKLTQSGGSTAMEAGVPRSKMG
jgi:hypothetical protein